MQLQQANSAVAATWILTAGTIGLLGNVTSISGAALVLGFGLVPPVLLMMRCGHSARLVPAPVRAKP